jgi:hypothetical protein
MKSYIHKNNLANMFTIALNCLSIDGRIINFGVLHQDNAWQDSKWTISTHTHNMEHLPRLC